MSKSNKEKKNSAIKRYPTEKLLKSKALSGYQPDFARVILKEPEYNIEEAKSALDAVLRREEVRKFDS